MPRPDDLKARSKDLKPLLRIGKNGITPTVEGELNVLLKKHHLVKVKFLKAGLGDKDKDDAAQELATAANADIVDRIGLTVTLYKEPDQGENPPGSKVSAAVRSGKAEATRARPARRRRSGGRPLRGTE